MRSTPSSESSFRHARETHARCFLIDEWITFSHSNDDGSSWYKHHDNFLAYGGHKSNFGGHNKFSYNNINVHAKVYQDGACLRVNAQNLGNYTDGYWNCTCTQDKDDLVAYTFKYCDAKNLSGSQLPK